ncbi:EF-hand domain-containing protein [Granulosicoccus antarcticus]|uniref:EF-hand domain-containing protein n=1 Tax=Granulosicoccus antarcticus IMCC3135 TaxID=1192854 RepID=A0A2Z2P2G3_9GAMM|nr:EF-hand domain-containing protein [Granulosicoccus antarcticus]ASJ76811.1 hypothetical protein IMCC3135_33855 [Granulosicoccus antarcticus IMCC3135]
MKRSTSKLAKSFALPLVLVAGIAAAQEDPAAIFESLDADGNGSLSEAEASANEMVMSKWETLDADGNSEISVEEMAAFTAE